MSSSPGLTREDAISQILGTVLTTGKRVVSTGVGTVASSMGYTSSSQFVEESGNYFLKTLFYLVLYAFFFFLVLLFVHFTIRPVFRFTPGGKGIVPIPGSTDDSVVWNTKRQPPPQSSVPSEQDTLAVYPFVNEFTFSVDIFVRRLTDTDRKNRLVLYKGPRTTDPMVGPQSNDEFIEFMSNRSSMIMYLTDTNDLVVTFFVGNTPIQYACPPIKNIPLYTPFRITVVVEEKIFTVYLNGKQTFQRITPTPITLNTKTSFLTGPQRFYSPPSWANSPSKSIFLQNFHLWPRSISYDEVIEAQPALARAEDFDLPPEPSGGSCA